MIRCRFRQPIEPHMSIKHMDQQRIIYTFNFYTKCPIQEWNFDIIPQIECFDENEALPYVPLSMNPKNDHVDVNDLSSLVLAGYSMIYDNLENIMKDWILLYNDKVIDNINVLDAPQSIKAIEQR